MFLLILIQYLLILLPCESFIPSCYNTRSTFFQPMASLMETSSTTDAAAPAPTDDNDDDGDGDGDIVSNEKSSFSQLGISPEIQSAVKAQTGWENPTAVQQLVIPQLLELDKDDNTIDSVWCEAPTGSGKTAAFALPLLQNIQKKECAGQIASLIVCPTRELAAQIGDVMFNLVNNISSKRKKNVMVMHGGTPIEPYLAALADYQRYNQTLDVLIATPGRLVDILTYYQDNDADDDSKHAQDAALERRLLDALDVKGSGDATLSLEDLNTLQLDKVEADGRDSLPDLLQHLQYLVLDEADRLLGRGFKDEVDQLLDLLPSNLPTWMFSATFSKSIEPRLNQVFTKVGATNTVRLECTHSDTDAIPIEDISSSLQKKLQRSTSISAASKLKTKGPASTIHLRMIRLEKNIRTQALRKLLDTNPQWNRVLVFVATRYASEHVSRKLRKVGIKASELHGKLDQDARARRLTQLKKGDIRVLITTDVACRGLDILGLPLMINYDLPRSTDDFIHRVGRTGRAGNKGTAITFITPASEFHMDLIEKRHLAQPIEREILPGFEPDEEKWAVEAEGSKITIPGTTSSSKGLAHDKMFGGVKGRRRKSKKDKLREAAAREAQNASN